jgi:hypothetical protein
MKERRIFNECSVKLAFTKPSLDKQEDVLIVSSKMLIVDE